MTETKRFRIVNGPIFIRQEAGTGATRTKEQLNNGQEILAEAASRTEKGNFVWWKHALGWSAERKLDNSEIYMVEVITTIPEPTATEIAPAATEIVPATQQITPVPQFFRVVDGPIRIRQLPDTSALRVEAQLTQGQQIEVVAGSRTDNDGFIWWQHALGWSVEKTSDDKEVYMQAIDPAADGGRNNTAVNTNTVPTLTLPSGKTIERPVLFVQHPVALKDTVWIQYFGNTQFAYKLQFERDPARQRMYYYCQSLHGGIDYGNNTPGAPIVAGMTQGIIEKVERNAKSYRPNAVRVTVGEFQVIYGHLGNVPPDLVEGMTVTPEMKMGEIEATQDHLHLEVRYKNTWIINPLLFMSPELSGAFTSKFSKFSQYFYSDATWTQWLTPFDQPVLKASTPDKAVLLGPRAARG